ncbi:hypothetical protein D3C75_875810 [compost metagenome]
MLGKIITGEIPAGSTHIIAYILSYRPLIEGVAPACRKQPQRRGQLRLHELPVDGRRPSAGKIDRRRLRRQRGSG